MTDTALNNGNPELSAEPCFPELFYGVLFHPVKTFQEIASNTVPTQKTLLNALFSIILISAIAPVIQLASVGGSPVSLALSIPLSTLFGLIIWAFTALVISMLSYAFTQTTRFKTLLTLSGLASLPWILMGPVILFKVGIGPVGAVLCAIFGLLIWLWTVLLFAYAIIATYQMSTERVMVILAMPFAMSLIFLGWILGFFGNISNLVPH